MTTLLTCMTEEARQKARLHNRLEKISKFLDEIEEIQTLDYLTPIYQNFYMKVRENFRIIFSIHQQNNYTILCMFDFLRRGGNEYLELRDNLSLKKTFAEKLHDKIEITNTEHFKQRIASFEECPQLPKSPVPDDNEYIWLNHEAATINQVIVLETEAWGKAQLQPHFKRSGNAIHRLLQDQIYTEIDKFHTENSQSQLTPPIAPYFEPSHVDDNDFRIHLQYFPSHHILMLLDLTKKDVTIRGFPEEIEREALISKAQRAYELDVFLLDPDDYFKIQEQQQGNLALSPEESDILAQVSQRENRFPLFINGRAGSGKSTILQYLLKDYLYLGIKHWNPEVRHTPLYLTYSKNLCEAASDHVSRLLDANANLLLRQGEEWQNNYKQYKGEILANTFKLFRDFLIELLPEETRERFVPERRIGYGQFKRLWEQRTTRNTELRRYTVDLVWHIIRTYIKGMSRGEGDVLTPDAYLDLPRKHRTVTDEDFKRVYDLVWSKWYQPHCQETGHWDDQDLALAVLDEATFPRTYPAVFCDEAQDFTAIELKILYHLSLFSERSIPPHSIGHIPFVFAGDPLQTLNPTGFRWESVKSSFHQYLLAPLERHAPGRTDFNYQELLKNYRSSTKIVGFCNNIQLLRLCLFSDRYQIRPQEAWFPILDAMTPFLYSVNTPKARELLGSNALVIIPNCHEDEEVDYVANDPVLRDTVECDEKGISPTVISPNMAKGLEYDQVVVLYRFGATCPKTLLTRLQGQGPQDPGANITIEWEYFLNRLYVAASRARRRLVILDELEAFHSFWGFMRDMDAEHLIRHLGVTVDPQYWGGDNILVIREGTDADLDDILQNRSQEDDTAKLAQKHYQKGMDAEDPKFLRMARLQYQRLSDQTKANECLAHALRLEGQYREAAVVFMQIDEYKLALDSLWAVSDFEEIARTNWIGDLRNDLRTELAPCLHSQRWTGSLEQTERAVRRVQNAMTSAPMMPEMSNSWRLVTTAIFNWIRTSNETGTLSAKWDGIHMLADRFDYPKECLAEIAHRLQRHDDALALWETSGKITGMNYYRSQYLTKAWPDNLRPLKQMNAFEEIIAEWQKNETTLKTPMDEDLAAIVIEATIEIHKVEEAVDLLCRQHWVKTPQILRPLTNKLLKLIDEILLKSQQDAKQVIQLHLGTLVNTKAWNDSRDWKELTGVLEKVDSLDKRFDEKNRHEIEQFLVECLAENHSLSSDETPTENRDKVSTLLRNRLRRAQDQWLPVLEKEISLPIAGAAIERANRLEDAIGYYYWVLTLRLQIDQYRYFEERLAACLQKRVEWRRQQGGRLGPDDESKDERKIDDLKRKLNIEFFSSDPNPSQYKGDGKMSRQQIKIFKESQRPVSTEEKDAEERLKNCDLENDEDNWFSALENLVKILAEKDKWHTLIQNWYSSNDLRRQYARLSEQQADKALTIIVKAIIKPLSCSVQVTESDLQTQQTLMELIVTRLRDNERDNTWLGCTTLNIDQDVAGSAIERLGRHIDAIQFYEWALKNQTTSNSRREMAKRLIAVRERHADYLRSTKDGQRRGDDQWQRAQTLRDQYKLTGQEIPRYPDLAF